MKRVNKYSPENESEKENATSGNEQRRDHESNIKARNLSPIPIPFSNLNPKD